MAELFLARGGEGNRLVVLKKILPTNAENPRFVRLFMDEARLVAGLDHPHIARVYDTGTADGGYYFTMEYIHGQDVRTVLRRTDRQGDRFPIKFGVLVARDIASALHYAHERRGTNGELLGIVHRDVSPSNVLVSYEGATKLVDFGVAKAATSSTKTRTGALKGKISYMSPEQARGGAIDRRSDIFSLGILLWEMATTRRLFKAENDLATIQMIINTPAPAPSSMNPECTPALDKVILKALSPTVEARYQTAEEIHEDLDAFVRDTNMAQSTTELGEHMNVLFAAEIGAWKAAQAAGITLVDHVVSKSMADVTTPISDSELSLEDDDEPSVDHDVPTTHRSPIDDDLAAPTIRTPMTPAAVRKPVIPTEAPTQIGKRRPPPPTPSQVFSQAEKTELSPPSMVELHDEATEIFPEPPIHMPRPSSSDQFAAALGSDPSSSTRMGTPFPVAPPEWLHRPEAEPLPDTFDAFRNRVLLIAGISVAVMLALSFVLGN
jgi:serine/threonine protein kinase